MQSPVVTSQMHRMMRDEQIREKKVPKNYKKTRREREGSLNFSMFDEHSK